MGAAELLGMFRTFRRYLPAYLGRTAIEDERAFVGFVSGSVSGGGTQTLHVENPTDDVSIDVQNIEFVAAFDGSFSIYDAFDSAPSNGSEVLVDNLLMGENGVRAEGRMNVTSGVSFSATGTHFSIPTGAGGNPSQSIPGDGRATTPIIEPGREIVIELDADSGSSGPAGIFVTYTELERVPSRA